MLLVQAVRRRVDHGVDFGIIKDRIEVVAQIDLSLLAEIFRLRAGSRVGGNEADVLALALDRIDGRLSPPAKAYNGGSDHVLPPSSSIKRQAERIKKAISAFGQHNRNWNRAEP
jgi:hypothetical protein